VLYSIGIVELELESTSALILLLFIVPLAFTLSGFLSWIMYALNGKFALPGTTRRGEHCIGTILQLQQRKQYYKLGMFKKLHYILMATVAVIGIFFVVSSMSFSNRLEEGKFLAIYLLASADTAIRLCCGYLGYPMVAIGRLAQPLISCSLCCYRLDLAADR
jgi:hypothetical protein